MSEEKSGNGAEEKTRGPVGQWFDDLYRRAPWFVAAALFRILYKFKVDGEEHFPRRGPFILAMNENSLHAMLVSGWVAIVMLDKVMETTPDAVQSFMMEELWSFSFFSDIIPSKGKSDYKPLMPQGAGRLALGLLDGIKALRAGGMVNINPEGDVTWDGRPLRPGKAMAWLALHTGAPIVPALASIGAYDIWPRWRRLPHLTGLMRLNIGKPFTLADEPMAVVEQNVTTFPVLVRIPNEESTLLPGMNAEVEIRIDHRENALIVPNEAVRTEKDALFVAMALGMARDEAVDALGENLSGRRRSTGVVFVPAGPVNGGADTGTTGGPGGFRPVRVDLGIRNWDDTEILSGLKEGDKVVVTLSSGLLRQQQRWENRAKQWGGMPGVKKSSDKK